ncbi:FMN-binding protein [Ideonella dechloratans]|uniref:FMN-binding protein n=1 Tax=Ideonella dechloratans TaxID=36863 RepID=A0A643FC92_IDEDE|nr:FMN-binding protein [Ideonella dechloratans]KAB0581402.1 FMN-binding protein [Ideonella dechloratans]UFU12366.1 FMN-binding protein [Ideonella dechloratans]
MRFWVTAAAMASASPAAFAVDYLSADQAAQLIFPEADHWDSSTLALDAAQLQALDAAGAKGRSARWELRTARKAGALLGWVLLDNVVGKYELISYAVGLDREGAIRGVEILSYRESHGSEIRLPAWRKQFVGKNASAPLRVGSDIANISGATLSCSHVTDGIRRIVQAVDVARRAQPAWAR